MENKSTIANYNCFGETHYGLILDCCIMSLCFTFGILTHSWGLWFHLCIERKSKPVQFFLLNQIVMELIISFVCLSDLLNIVIFQDNTLYIVNDFIFSVSWISRLLIQTCICVEQCLVVFCAETFLKDGIKYRLGAAVLTWSTAFGYGAYDMNSVFFPDDFFISVFFISVIVNLFCCGLVLRAQKTTGSKDTQTEDQTVKDVREQQKRDTFKTIVKVLLIILFTYLPQVSLKVFTWLEIDSEIFYCNFIPIVNSINVFGALVMPLLKMYKEGYLNLNKLTCAICGTQKSAVNSTEGNVNNGADV